MIQEILPTRSSHQDAKRFREPGFSGVEIFLLHIQLQRLLILGDKVMRRARSGVYEVMTIGHVVCLDVN